MSGRVDATNQRSAQVLEPAQPMRETFQSTTAKVHTIVLGILSVIYALTGAVLLSSLFFTPCGFIKAVLQGVTSVFCFSVSSELCRDISKVSD